ncbi:hypothetical protein [Actinokineospora sp. NBRC 105648]|uniref:hypothetical protein n=1 Tax=Actinokineospora sp. NBRC 105648 TaxID=3032206 RepID=UPI0025561FAA|nr:hypothetical protein [Actinokineospora sp. NBRC 105648]
MNTPSFADELLATPGAGIYWFADQRPDLARTALVWLLEVVVRRLAEGREPVGRIGDVEWWVDRYGHQLTVAEVSSLRRGLTTRHAALRQALTAGP